MHNKYLANLHARRTELESKLELHIARYCFGEEEVDDGTEADLRERIREVTDEIAALENEHSH
jgi:hypothetical protein